MRRKILWLLTAIWLAALLPAAAGALCYVDVLHLVSDFDTGQCSYAPVVDEPFTLYLVLKQDWPQTSIMDVEGVKLPDWPIDFDPELGTIEYTWNSDTHSGHLATGLDLHWDEPLEPFSTDGEFYYYLLGTLDIVAHDSDWLAGGHYEFAWGEGGYTDIWDDTSELMAGYFTFDDAKSYDCEMFIVDPPSSMFFANHFLPRPDEVVPELITFEFDAYRYWCLGGGPTNYPGSIYLDGALIHEFEGEGINHYQFSIDLAGYQTGDEIEVHLHLARESGSGMDYYLHYTLGTGSTAVQSASFSTVKSLY